jgi:hypothetical protein
MSDFINFITENYIIITITVLSIIGLLVYISVYNINLDPPKTNSKLSQIITVETFSSNIVDESIEGGLTEFKSMSGAGNDIDIDLQMVQKDGPSNFCDKFSSSPEKLKSACNNISDTTCQNLPCCALISGSGTNSCVGADKYGPMVKTITGEDGIMIPMDSYYYQGNKYTVA